MDAMELDQALIPHLTMRTSNSLIKLTGLQVHIQHAKVSSLERQLRFTIPLWLTLISKI